MCAEIQSLFTFHSFSFIFVNYRQLSVRVNEN